jgi:hypothetical protein
MNGIGLINSFVAVVEKRRSNKLTALDVFQFASSCMFFSMSAINIKTANSIITETQNNVISDFEASLRSNRHRRMFRRVAKETRGEDGMTMHGNAKVRQIFVIEMFNLTVCMVQVCYLSLVLEPSCNMEEVFLVSILAI